MRTLVLWDIDHTLVDIGQLSGEIYGDAFRHVTGRPMKRLADMTGRTDRAIISETLELNYITPTEDILIAFADELAVQFEAQRELIKRVGRTLAGATTILASLAVMPHVIQSVLTGNMMRIAVLKLDAFDLGKWIDVEIGAYGMDGIDRAMLVPVAQHRATEKYGHRFDKEKTILIGDTPNDIKAGRDGGARVIAVATGSSSVNELRRGGADLVLSDLSNHERAINLIRETISDG